MTKIVPLARYRSTKKVTRPIGCKNGSPRNEWSMHAYVGGGTKRGSWGVSSKTMTSDRVNVVVSTKQRDTPSPRKT